MTFLSLFTSKSEGLRCYIFWCIHLPPYFRLVQLGIIDGVSVDLFEEIEIYFLYF